MPSLKVAGTRLSLAEGYRVGPRYGAVLVPAGLGSESESLVQDAVHVANAFGARLLGVSTPMTEVTPLSPVEAYTLKLLLEAAGEHFRHATSQVYAGSLWRRILLKPGPALISLSWAADLLLSDYSASTAGGMSLRELRSVMARTRRPILVRTCPGRRLAWERVLILWDQSAACRRSIEAAMPLLVRSQEIVVLQATPQHLIREDALCDLERGLGCRKLQVRVEGRKTRLKGSAIEDLLKGLDPDLLVLSGRRRWLNPPLARYLSMCEAYAMMGV